jgi:hypothetical protein
MDTTRILDDVSCDTVKLAEEIAALPASCPCDEAVRARGHCCCHIGPLELASVRELEACGGCVLHLRRLTGRVASLRESLRLALDRPDLDALDAQARQALGLLAVEVGEIGLVLRRVSVATAAPSTRCMHELLAPLGGHAPNLTGPLSLLEAAVSQSLQARIGSALGSEGNRRT